MERSVESLHALRLLGHAVFLGALITAATGCVNAPKVMDTDTKLEADASDYAYLIGAGDRLDIFVWRNPEVSVTDVPVRPDGYISSPLVQEMAAAGKTPEQLAADIARVLGRYIKDPLVTVTVREFVGDYREQVKVIGAAATPQTLPYRQDMTLLDVMIAVGGLTDYASGNRAVIVRRANGVQRQIRARLDDLLRDGDISANTQMYPGDILIIPESWF